jgi:hypothetical protein
MTPAPLLALALATASVAPPADLAADPADLPAAARSDAAAPRREGPFLGPRYRYGAMPVYERTLWDLVAIPANVPSWSAFDWAFHGAVTASVITLMWPADPSPDVRIDRWIGVHVAPHKPEVWSRPMQAVLWGSIAVGGLAGWTWAATHDRPDVAQGFSLMAESLAVGQIYHVTLKALIGREGPGDGSDLGRVLGPFQSLEYYPAGTPSGHAATLTSLLSSGLAYFDPPWYVHAVGYGAVGSLVALHVLDQKHYLSDSLWGAALGWWVGRWVVEHRASRGAGAAPQAGLRASVAPMPVRGGLGLSLVGGY